MHGSDPGGGNPLRPRSPTGITARLEHLVVPTTDRPAEGPDGYHRVVFLVAGAVMLFFVPSLPLAGVPSDRWLPFTAIAALAAIWIAGSLLVVRRESTLGIAVAVVNGLIVTALGALFQPYFHEIALLLMLLVGGHAVINGLRAALGIAAVGAVTIPHVIQADMPINVTDHVYALIYLTGAALIPWTASRLAAHRAAAIRHQLERRRAAEREAVLTLARASEARDEATGNHVARVGDLSAALGERVGMSADEVDDLRRAAMLHDVGKLHVPDSILLKPGPLTPEERAIVERHTVWGERILGDSAAFELARRIARSHHEQFDGSGYPDGLRGTAIPLGARIVHITDVFDALCGERPYKAAWPVDLALEWMTGKGRRGFDPELLLEFVALVEAVPIARTAPVAPPAPVRTRVLARQPEVG